MYFSSISKSKLIFNHFFYYYLKYCCVFFFLHIFTTFSMKMFSNFQNRKIYYWIIKIEGVCFFTLKYTLYNLDLNKYFNHFFIVCIMQWYSYKMC